MKKKRVTKKFNYRVIISFSFSFFLFVLGLSAYVKSYSEFVTTIQKVNSGISDNIVYINDAESDLNYYLGLNYTYTTDATLPTGTNNNYYNENTLVETKVTYSGTDINNNLVGYVSLNERQNTFVYYKYYPVNDNGTTDLSDDYILIELIDNPFADRPTNKAFNGWYTNYLNAEISFDSDYYLRYAKVPITYANNVPNAVDITFNTSWINATVYRLTSTNNNAWNNAMNSLKSKGMEQVDVYERHYLPYDMTGYFYQENIGFFGSCSGYYNDNGIIQGNCTCYSWGGCTYYRRIENENFNEDYLDYYYKLDGTMQRVTLDDLDLEYTVNYYNGFNANSIMAGYYKLVHRDYGESIDGLYNEDGEILSGTSYNGNTDYYELIQYRDENNNISNIDFDSEYYYLVTRDTNIVYLGVNLTRTWGTSATKPFTFTGLHNGTLSNYRWDVGSLAVRAYSDIRIEQMIINSGQTKRSANPPTSNSTARTLYGNGYNLKVGRGIRQYNGNGNFSTVVAGTNGSMGSRTNVKKYSVILESGIYNAVSLTNGASNPGSTTNYLEVKAIYGSDYDKVSNNGGNNNNNLDVYYCASGSWGGDIYASSNEGISYDLVVKSGNFGDLKSDNTNGIYVGGRYGGVHYTSRKAKIEGGWIYNLIGGPLTASNRSNINDSYIYVTGGEVDLIIGGAGQTATYGNRIIQVTGGTINYSVFGGSNGSDGSEGDGTVNGSSFIYIGGSSKIGKKEYVDNNSKIFGAEAGSVFGIGNGKEGSSTIGSSDNSHIIIADNAIVRNSVYGGGNFGATGISSSSNTTTSKIDILNGTINGSVYGGGNQNGSGSSSKTSSITINMYDGTVKGSVYGGSNVSGTVYGNVEVNIKGGIVENSVYGGGKGGIETSPNQSNGTYVSRNVNVTIGDNNLSTVPTIGKNVYGGSAFGTVNGTTNNNNVSSYNTNVVVNKGTVTGSIFGGGEGDSTHTPYVLGGVKVVVNDGTSTNIYGGNDQKGTPNGTIEVTVNGGTSTNIFGGGNLAPINTSTVYLKGGTSTNVYGGGNLANATTTNVLLQGATTTNLFGGSNQSGDVTTSNITTTSGTATTIYGGNNLGGTTTNALINVNGGNITTVFGGGNEAETGTTTVNLNGPNISNVYGGGNKAETGTTNVNLNNGSITNVYGGGNQAGITNSTNVKLSGASVTTLYGGSNESGVVASSNITTTSGSATTIYGGNNSGGSTTNSLININGGTMTDVFGGGNEAVSGTTQINLNNGTSTNIFGGGNKAVTGTTQVNLNSGTSTNVYGGGNEAGITTSTLVNLNGSNITSIFGGSNKSGTVPTSTINTTNGSVQTIYGGNNLGGSTTDTNINVNGANITTVLGGGNEAQTTSSNVVINSWSITDVYGGGNLASVDTTKVTHKSGYVQNIYGGGNKAGITTSTTVSLEGGTTSNIYGGSNQSGVVAESNVDVSSGTVTTIYGGNNLGGSTTVANVTTTGGTINEVYGGGNVADTITTNVSVSGSNISNVYGGGNKASVTTSNVEVLGNTRINNLFGGSNMQGTVTTSHINIPFSGSTPTITNVYGGNNQGGTTTNANIDIHCGTIDYVYGGGNYAATGSTNTSITGATVNRSIYGGGNQAAVHNNAVLNLNNVRASENVYGGGNLGTIGGNTTVNVLNSTLGSSLFGGGNGYTAAVYGNTLLNVGGTTNVSRHVFGGGNAAPTGTEEDNDSTSVVNIAGLTCGGNVYGGANTSVLYGTVTVNIGQNAVDNTINTGDIHIGGTVFGGGEANESGSEIYDFSFISVTEGITINVDAQNHSVFEIDGSIFGSGNASSTSGFSSVNIKNYGTDENYKKNVSIQRASLVTLDNSSIELAGATDRTNEYSDVLFSLSRIDELKLLNNSTLYLETGSNLVKKFTSGLLSNGVETKATVEIDDDGDITRNVNNKLYIYEGKNINIATNENITAYGEVSGMTFFGMYSHDRDGNVFTALYNTDYDSDSTVPSSEIVYFTKGSYVLGLHKTNHNYEQDGFYSNFSRDDAIDKIDVKYIVPTPEDSNYYIWAIGEQVTAYEITLTASKYSTLGTYELPLINFSDANTSISVLGFNYSELESDVDLVDKSEIARVASSGTVADHKMSLVMKSGDSGWLTIGKTTFLSSEEYCSGTTNYIGENSNTVPTFLFYLYHSKNLETSGDMGTVTISLVAITAKNDLENEIKRININVNLNRAIYTTNDYEGTITQGKVYEMFAPSTVNITATSAFTTYYSLFVESNDSIYRNGYHRVLSSSYNFPENTKITMIDLLSGTTPEYYYYVVTNNDYQSNLNSDDITYKLSKFVRMGSSNTNNHYDDAIKNDLYYDSDSHYAEEEFIFIVDFKESGIEEDVLNKSLLLELRNNENEIILSVIGVEQQQLFYNLYSNKDSIINVDATISSNDVYIGEKINLNVYTNFEQQTINSNPIIDTNFYDYKSGIKLSILDSNNNVVNGSSLLGLSYTIGNDTYYPRFDGTTRINIAERIANVSTRIIINTEGSNLASGNYKLLIESFASPDGIYYGLTSSDFVEIPFVVKNTIYGLMVNINDSELVIDKTSGLNDDKTNTINSTINYSSGLLNPNLRISLFRRDYEEVYSNKYNLVNLKDYVSDELESTNIENVYMLFNPPTSTMTTTLHLKENLMSGTYRLEFALYDNNTFIGSVYKYIVIK